MDMKKARVTTRDGQVIFHRLIRDYKRNVPRLDGQPASDYQQEAEAWARRQLQQELEALLRERVVAILNGQEPPAAH